MSAALPSAEIFTPQQYATRMRLQRSATKLGTNAPAHQTHSHPHPPHTTQLPASTYRDVQRTTKELHLIAIVIHGCSFLLASAIWFEMQLHVLQLAALAHQHLAQTQCQKAAQLLVPYVLTVPALSRI